MSTDEVGSVYFISYLIQGRGSHIQVGDSKCLLSRDDASENLTLGQIWDIKAEVGVMLRYVCDPIEHGT